MTIIVESGAGLANAESYISVAAATAYLRSIGTADAAWLDLDTPIKEQCLRRATNFMEQRYATRWRGYRMTDTQSLSWPRGWVERGDVAALLTTSSSWYLPNNAVPALVANACAELALRANTLTLSPDLGPMAIEETVGPVTVKYAAGTRESLWFRAVDDMLNRFLKPGGSGAMRNVVRS